MKKEIALPVNLEQPAFEITFFGIDRMSCVWGVLMSAVVIHERKPQFLLPAVVHQKGADLSFEEV
ncbi:hypothetical protein ES703_44758 [subsurface metagenome]